MVKSCYHTLLFISFSVFQLVRCDGKVLLPYKDNLLEVLGHVLQLKCVHGYELAGQLLRFTLRALTLEFILNFQSVAGSYDRPVSEYLAIRVSRDIQTRLQGYKTFFMLNSAEKLKLSINIEIAQIKGKFWSKSPKSSIYSTNKC